MGEFADINQRLKWEIQKNQKRSISHQDTLGKLKELRLLDLSFNQLTSLPEEIGQLSNLWALYLLDNQLSSLPRSIEQLESLKSLNLDGNQLSAQEAARIKNAFPDIAIIL